MKVRLAISPVVSRSHTLLPGIVLSLVFWFCLPPATLAGTQLRQESMCFDNPAQVPVANQGGDGDGVVVEAAPKSAIHTTFVDEITWAKSHGMEDFDFRSEPQALSFLKLLKSVCTRYGYPSGSPYKVRVVSVKGEYPGDSLVPDYLRIYDGGEFSMDDYGEVIIRTDSAICEAFSYGRHAPYYDMGRRSQSISIGSRSRYPTGRPSMVICIMRKARPGARK